MLGRFVFVLLGSLPCVFGMWSCYSVAGLGDFGPAGDAGRGGDEPTTDTSASSENGSSASNAAEATSSSSSSQGCATHLLLTEIRTGIADMVEIFNPTATDVPLANWSLEGLTSAGEIHKKWTGAGMDVVRAGDYFLLTLPNQDGDGVLTGFANTSIVVARLIDTTGSAVDTLCICDQPGCTLMDFPQTCSRALILPGFPTSTSQKSVQRRSECEDTDDDSADLVDACPTPRKPISQAAANCE